MPSFGVPHLDDVFAGQAPRQPLLLVNGPGVEALPFAVQAAHRALVDGGHVVFLSFDRPPRRAMALVGPPRDARARFHLLDGFSHLHGVAEPVGELLPDGDLHTVIDELDEQAAAHPDALLVVDSLNGLLMRNDSADVVAAADRLLKALSAFHDAVVTYTAWGEEVGIQPLLESFPHRISLQAVQERIVSHQYFCVDRVGGTAYPDAGRTLYRADDVGVRVYVPKIVVTGPADAGKTTFVHAVSDRARSAERLGATVAMDRGTIDHGGLRVELFGMPGQERFDPLHGALIGQAVGIVLIVDATAPETFPRALEMLQRAWRHGLPAVVAANKQDLPGALDAQTVQARLGAPDGIAVMPCHALQAQEALDVMDHLVERILTPPEVAA